MSGPIVRSGATPAFSKNWENVFGGKKSKSVAAAVAAKPTKKKAAKKSTKKKAKK